MTSPYETAKSQGHSDEEIFSYLRQSPKYSGKIEKAKKQGYSDEEINSFLKTYTPKSEEEEKNGRSWKEKVGRLAGQFGLGMVENALLPYELGVAPLSSKDAQNVSYRQGVGEDIERLLEQKSMGQWDENDQILLDDLQKQIKNPRESEKHVQTADIGLRGLAEKSTGLDLHPEGKLEHAANWLGFIKKPSNFNNLSKFGFKPKEVIKSISPTRSEFMSAAGAGIALDEAEKGEFGPIGTMAAVVVGDLLGRSGSGLSKLVTSPKKTLAKASANIKSKFSTKEAFDLQKEIIKDFRENNIQADLGTITDSNLIKWTQARAAQSGFTGKKFNEFMDKTKNQIKQEYKNLADSLGEAKYASKHEAGEVVKESVKNIRDSELGEIRKLYNNASSALKPDSSVNASKLALSIQNLRKNLIPGNIKSTEQKAVLDVISRLEKDIRVDQFGKVGEVSLVKNLMNDKIALNDIINYEVQGGTKQLLKGLVADIDRAIISHGAENPTFAKNYVGANKRFSEHAKTFRNKDIDSLLRNMNPDQIMKKMNSVQGVKNFKNVLTKTKEGKEVFDNIKRMKMDEIIGNNLAESSAQQVRLGTFSNIMEKGKNRELLKEILNPVTFNRLKNLQKNSGRLSDAINKFYNASQSGVVAADAAIIGKAMTDIANLIAGNPWPLIKTAGGLLTARKLTNLLADEGFLKLVEDAILTSEKGSPQEIIKAFERLKPYIMKYVKDQNQSNET